MKKLLYFSVFLLGITLSTVGMSKSFTKNSTGLYAADGDYFGTGVSLYVVDEDTQRLVGYLMTGSVQYYFDTPQWFHFDGELPLIDNDDDDGDEDFVTVDWPRACLDLYHFPNIVFAESDIGFDDSGRFVAGTICLELDDSDAEDFKRATRFKAHIVIDNAGYLFPSPLPPLAEEEIEFFLLAK